ncbi:cobalt ABC transporter, inner membrane subunit CbiQ [Magnetococcus marinus MC-1]|uniref:Cobalt ABC transporter, inner membrane subunit CbiQ n=1 Tax=Magnetococcus marinus (strain ATCC BAA-1437 / JCM 17883 / MC-1) TaxID=156889 RepID=A0LCD6_MAGMM|nr:cobalt ECF transporter T component CbiQ [Magnetococcus marinus]ABK45629.1 cobalt ABC transporter, inner membrane subunit CbiQ [Magnetococcus marinus MC-1]
MSHTVAPVRTAALAALPQASWLHRIDPRLRIVCALLFALVQVALHELEPLGAGVAMGLAMVLMARLPWRTIIKRTLGVDLFVVFLLVMLPFSVAGELWFSVGPWQASWQGLQQAAEIGLKAVGVMLMLLALVGTQEPHQLGHALHRLGVPDKLVLILLFTARYLEVLRMEYGRLRIAMKCRGFQPRSNGHTWRSFGYLFGMLLVRSLERSERIYAAMKCRGFTGHFYVLSPMGLGRGDGLFGLCFGLLLLVLGGW